jgi:hypothetical protein
MALEVGIKEDAGYLFIGVAFRVGIISRTGGINKLSEKSLETEACECW